MYRVIAEDLRQRIESGEWESGSRLSTELELRDEYDASRNTVRDAMKWLINRGLVETRPGHGTFVVEKIDPYVTFLTGDPRAGRDNEGPVYLAGLQAAPAMPTSTEPRVEIQQATGVIKNELQLADGSTVVSRCQQLSVGRTPWSLQTSFYPMSLVNQGALKLIQSANIADGAVAYLGAELGLHQAGYRDTITVRAPDAAETGFFRLPDDGRVAVFEVCRTAFDDRGQPFRLTISVYRTDRSGFAVKVGQVPGHVAGQPGRQPATEDEAADR